MIPPLLSTAGIIHVRLCQLETVNMTQPIQFKPRIIHVRLCQMKTVYMLPQV